MNRVSDRFLQLGVLGALVGMGLGVWMGKTEDFLLMPVHAHTNLLCWVSMLLYGLFYRSFPQAAAGKLAGVHFWLNLVGVLIMLPMLAFMLLARAQKPVFGISGDTAGMALGVSSILVWLSMLLFAVIVFRATSNKSA